MSRQRARIRIAAGAATAAVAITGAVAATPVAAAATRTPPCTRAALQAGLTRGQDPVRSAHVISPFGCSGVWAYAAVNTKRFTLSSLFTVRDGRWVTVDRRKPCADGAVPKAIRKPACNSN